MRMNVECVRDTRGQGLLYMPPELEPHYVADGQAIYYGDNCDVLRHFPIECVDLVVTSPPYDALREYGGAQWDFHGLSKQLVRVIKPGGVIVWVVNDQTIDGDESGSSFEQALHFKHLGLRLHDTMIFQKNGSSFPQSTRYYQVFEFMFVFSKGNPKTFNPIADRKNYHPGKRYGRSGRHKNGNRPIEKIRHYVRPESGVRFNIWMYQSSGVVGVNHPALFPKELAADHIKSWSNEGDVVLDPFSGSGTTVLMARKMGRKGIGIEINQEYVDESIRRLRQKVLF